MNPSQKVAAAFGETRGRSISRVIGTGISRATNGAVSVESGTDFGHALMFVAAIVPPVRVAILGGLAVSYLVGR